jgi:hypothetical protein
MNVKARVGICRKLECYDNGLVIIPKDRELFEDNELVVVIGADDLSYFAENVNGLIKFMESVKKVGVQREDAE